MPSVTSFLDSLMSALGFADFYIPLGGSIYWDYLEIVRFVVFLFFLWFVARLCRFLVLRVKSLFGF